MKPIHSPVSRGVSRLATLLLLFFAVGASTSCVTHFEWNVDDAEEVEFDDSLGPLVLASRATGDGATTTYSVSGQTRRFPQSNRKLAGAVIIATKATVDLPFLGLEATSVDNATAKDLGVEAWRGVVVSKVEPDSAAFKAGLRRTDLLLSVNGMALASEAQFADLVSGTLLPGDTIEIEVSRATSDFARGDLEVSLVVGTRTVEETSADRVDLPLDPVLVQRAGIGVLTIPSDLAGRVYDERFPVAVIAAVVTGSPAYLAGFRAGDRVMRANGIPVSTALELRDVVESGEDRLRLEVQAMSGSHSEVFDLVTDVTDESRFSIPLLVGYDSRADRTRLSVLDFIFQFGFNKRSHYLQTVDRKPRKSSFLSILPLGMFEFERTPTRSSNRIFWFIRWSSKR